MLDLEDQAVCSEGAAPSRRKGYCVHCLRSEIESLRKRLAEIEGEIQESVDDLDANEIPAARAHLSMITKGD